MAREGGPKRKLACSYHPCHCSFHSLPLHVLLGAAFTGTTALLAGLEVTVGLGLLAGTAAATAGLDVAGGLEALAGLAAWASRRWWAPAAGPQRKGIPVLTGPLLWSQATHMCNTAT